MTDDQTQAEADDSGEREPVVPVESRFMFVDIAALRAKQLRRGAVPRVPTGVESQGEDDAAPTPSLKLERIAMAEVENCLISYQAPDPTAEPDEDAEEAVVAEGGGEEAGQESEA